MFGVAARQSPIFSNFCNRHFAAHRAENGELGWTVVNSSALQARPAWLPRCRAARTTSASGSEDARLRALLDRFFYERLRDNPEGATTLGLDEGERANLRFLLNDRSPAARRP
jgi:hypothetical protein